MCNKRGFLSFHFITVQFKHTRGLTFNSNNSVYVVIYMQVDFSNNREQCWSTVQLITTPL